MKRRIDWLRPVQAEINAAIDKLPLQYQFLLLAVAPDVQLDFTLYSLWPTEGALRAPYGVENRDQHLAFGLGAGGKLAGGQHRWSRVGLHGWTGFRSPGPGFHLHRPNRRPARRRIRGEVRGPVLRDMRSAEKDGRKVTARLAWLSASACWIRIWLYFDRIRRVEVVKKMSETNEKEPHRHAQEEEKAREASFDAQRKADRDQERADAVKD